MKGRPNAFSHLKDFDESMGFILEYVKIWERWMHEKGVLIARYEDLLTNYDAEAARLVEYLHLDHDRSDVQEVIGQYRPEKAESQQSVHFYKGKIGRFRQVYSAEQQKALADRFAPVLPKMGYAL